MTKLGVLAMVATAKFSGWFVGGKIEAICWLLANKLQIALVFPCTTHVKTALWRGQLDAVSMTWSAIKKYEMPYESIADNLLTTYHFILLPTKLVPNTANTTTVAELKGMRMADTKGVR